MHAQTCMQACTPHPLSLLCENLKKKFLYGCSDFRLNLHDLIGCFVIHLRLAALLVSWTATVAKVGQGHDQAQLPSRRPSQPIQ